MKLVKEHINEKFIQDSDPISDLGIGIYNKFKKWYDNLHISRDEFSAEILIECIKQHKYDFIQLFINRGFDLNYEDSHFKSGVFLRYAAVENDIKMIDILIESGAIISNETIGDFLRHCSIPIKSMITRETKNYVYKKIKEYEEKQK